MRKGRISAFLLGLVLLLSACQNGGSDTLQTASNVNKTEFHVSDITPATDYFGYINAETLMGLELEPGKSYAGVTIDMLNDTSDKINGIIDEVVTSSKDYPKGSNEQIIRDSYKLMIAFYEGDEEKDKSDEAIIDNLIERTNQIKDMDELIDYWGELNRDYMINSPIDGGVKGDIYDSKRNVLIISIFLPASLEDVSSSSVKAGVERDNMKSLFCLTGLEEPEARERATNIVYMFSDIAGKCEFEDEDEEDKDNIRSH